MLVWNSLVCSRLCIYFHCARKYCNCLENFCILEKTGILFKPSGAWTANFSCKNWIGLWASPFVRSFVHRRVVPVNKTWNGCLCLYVNFSVIILKYLTLVNPFSDLFSVLTFAGSVLSAAAAAAALPGPTVLLLLLSSVLYLKWIGGITPCTVFGCNEMYAL